MERSYDFQETIIINKKIWFMRCAFNTQSTGGYSSTNFLAKKFARFRCDTVTKAVHAVNIYI